MRWSERLALLVRLGWRELVAARAWWIFLTACGALVGQAYGTAVATYAEVSGGNGGPAALSQGVSPLDGFVVPLFGAYAVAATLLLPFVAIRLLAAEKDGGGLALLLQGGARPPSVVLADFLVAMLGWVVALVPGVVALALWRVHGGHLDASELGVVLLGHLLRAAITVALGLAAAAWTESASTAAIVALGVTLATWALDFVAAVQGGVAERIGAFTPEAALRVFERGELSASVIAASVVVMVALLAVAAHGLRAARPPKRTAMLLLAMLGGTAMALAGAAMLRGSADLSEDRRNSFPAADERALASINGTVDVEVHLAPEDPRLADLERSVLRKLERVLPNLRVRRAWLGTSGLFASDSSYGEVWYSVDGRRAMSRSTTPAIVLETLYGLARVRAPHAAADDGYPGYPLVLSPGLDPVLFYLTWPLVIILGWRLSRRRARSPELSL